VLNKFEVTPKTTCAHATTQEGNSQSTTKVAGRSPMGSGVT
jgi:hypothetical protein